MFGASDILVADTYSPPFFGAWQPCSTPSAERYERMNQARKRVCGCWSPQVGSHSGRAAFHGPLVRILPRCPHLGSFGAVRAILPANPFWGVLWSAARGRRGRVGTLHCTRSEE